MKEKEVRIGNLVRYGDNICIVRAIYLTHFSCVNKESGIDYGNSIQANYKPIPLTEEWIIKLGLISNPYKDRYEIGNICIECDKTKGFTDLWIEKMPHIKYVHQLQNLYFALTGNELTPPSK